MGERLIKLRHVARAIIVDDEGKVLLGMRARGTGAGQWALIGGKVDAGETKDCAVLREVKEEIDVNFICPSFFKTQLDINSIPGQAWEAHYFAGKIEGHMNPDEAEVTDLEFFSEDEIEDLDIAFDHKDIIISFFQSIDLP